VTLPSLNFEKYLWILWLNLVNPCYGSDQFVAYNKSQQDPPILNFSLVKNSTGFEQIYCPSSGVLILYSQQLAFVMLVMLTSDSKVRSSCCEYGIKAPDDGQ